MISKNYIIIGGSSGIGKALTNSLASSGHQVYATYNSNPIDSNENIIAVRFNAVNDELDLSVLPDVIDGVVYCPGSINLMPFGRIKPENFRDDFDLQVLGAIKVVQSLYPQLIKSDQGSIVLFSTVAVKNGFNFHSQVSVSKGAIEGLTRSLAAEFAPKVRVNAIAPSLTNTPLASKLINSDNKVEANANRHPLKKIGQPEDISEMAAFLLSEKAQWITGQIIHVDGGMSTIKL
ncbi:MAG: SDR family NAD(P)-dependent oxidoreductase [Crocinitomicaceae bacterium]